MPQPQQLALGSARLIAPIKDDQELAPPHYGLDRVVLSDKRHNPQHESLRPPLRDRLTLHAEGAELLS